MKKQKIHFKKIIDGTFLTDRKFVALLPLIFVSSGLLIIYIANRYSIENTLREKAKMTKNIKKLQDYYYEQRGKYQRTTLMLEVNKRLVDKQVEISKEAIKQKIIINISPKENGRQ
jgi:hypothetical protein